MIGSGTIGALIPGGSVGAASMKPATDPVNVLDDRGEDFVQPSPWLEFWEIETGGSGTLRYVDFADPDAGGATVDVTPFNGSNWTFRRISRAAIEATIDALPSLDVNMEDPTGDLIQIVRSERDTYRWGMANRSVTIYRIPYDKIDTPALAEQFRLKIFTAAPTTNPAGVRFTIGVQNFKDLQYPRGRWVRGLCPHRYDRRFISTNGCRYPSDEFESGTAQTFGGDYIGYKLPAATERRFGWWSMNADRCSEWHSGQARTIDPYVDPYTGLVSRTYYSYLQIAASGNTITWKDASQYGPYQWKLIDGDFDLTIEHQGGVGPSGGAFSGLLLQDPDSLGDWLAWGIATNPATGNWTFRCRQTASNVSTDTDDYGFTGAATYSALRLIRSGDTITLKYKFVTSTDWEDGPSKTMTGLSSTVRIGVFASNDNSGAQTATATYRRFAFLSGGLPTCNLTLSDCLAHSNAHQFLAIPELQGAN